MTYTKFSSIVFVVFLISLMTATAAVNIVEDSVTIDVDYQDFNDEDLDTIVQTTKTFTLENDATEEAIVTISVTGLPEDYGTVEKEVTVPAATADAVGTESVTFELDVPHQADPGEADIGTIVVTNAAGTEEDTASLTQNTLTMIEITKLEFSYTDEKGKSTDDDFDGDGTSFSFSDDVKPFTEIVIEIEIENLFDNDYDKEGELDSVVVTIDASPNDIFPSGFEEEYDLPDIEAGSEEQLTVSFIIDEDADPDDYTFEITVEADDGESITYELNKEIDFKLEQEKDDLRIIKADVISTAITACDASFALDFEMKNFGSKDQDFGGVVIYNKELGINENIDKIKVEEHGDDDTWSQLFTLNLDNPAVKEYTLDVQTFVDQDELSDDILLKVNVGKCNGAVEEPATTPGTQQGTEQTATVDVPETAGQDTTTTQQTESDATVVGSGDVVQSIEEAYTSYDMLVAVFIVGIVLVVAIIILLIAVLLKK